MRKFHCLLFVLKRSYNCYYIICMTVPVMTGRMPYSPLMEYCAKYDRDNLIGAQFSFWLSLLMIYFPEIYERVIYSRNYAIHLRHLIAYHGSVNKRKNSYVHLVNYFHKTRYLRCLTGFAIGPCSCPKISDFQFQNISDQ